MDAYETSEPIITGILKTLYRKCPLLFDSLVTKSEQRSLSPAMDEGESDDESALLQSGASYGNVNVIGRLWHKYCVDVLRVPIRPSHELMTQGFKSMLRAALKKDFGMPNIMHFGNSALQWYKKISFTSKFVSKLLYRKL